jgi:hypothetical protein
MTRLQKYLNNANAEYIECVNKHINSLREYPKLKVLNCSGNNITKLPIYPKLRTLICGRNKISEIRIYPKLEQLYCNSCDELREIQLCPNLKVLYCLDNNKLVKIANIDTLEVLNCSGSNKLKIPYLRNLKSLQCSRCHFFELEGITDVSSYHNYISRYIIIVYIIMYTKHVSKRIGSVISNDINRLIFTSLF